MVPESPEVPRVARAVPSAQLKAWGILLLAGGTWGITFSLAKIATEGGAHPFGITLWQAIIGFVLLFSFDRLRRRPLPFDRRHLVFYLVCGLLGTAVPASLFFYASPHLPAGVLSITLATVPIMTFVGARLLGIDRLSVARLTGIALGAAAIAMIAVPETSLPDPAAAPWVLVAIVASLCYALENLYIARRRPPGSDAITVLCGMMLAAALVLAPLVLATGTFTFLPWPWGPVELSVLAMSLINVVAYGLFVYLVTASGPVFAGQMAYVVTLSGVIWGMVIFGELHSTWIWGALVAMIVGLALVKPKKRGAHDGT